MGLQRSALRRSSMRRSGSGGGTPTPSNPGNVADWDLTLVRYFLVDYDGGDDANTGYVDAAAGATIVPTGLAKKTINSGLMDILPRTGNGRKCVVLVKNRAAGATYLDADGVTVSDVDLSACTGYAFAAIRGSSDLTNSALDRVLLGGVTGFAGPNGNGSWTAAAGATVKQLTVAAGSLPAEPTTSAPVLSANILGMRVRFTGDVTGALANICTASWRNGTGTSTIEFGQDLATIPAANNTFFLERPGTRFNTFRDFACRALPQGSSSDGVVNARGFTAGIGVVSTTAADSFLFGSVGGGPQITYSFCEAAPSSWVANIAGSRIIFSPTYNDEVGTPRDAGVGVRSSPLGLFTGGSVVSPGGVSNAGAAFTAVERGLFSLSFTGFTDIPRLLIAGANYVGGGLVISGGIASFPSFAGNNGLATVGRLRLARAASVLSYGAAGCCVSGHVFLSGVEWQDCTTGPCIFVNSFNEPNFINLRNCVAAAAGNNTQYGMSIGSSAMGTRVSVNTADVTVTGTLGDVRFVTDSVITPWATLTRTNIVDRFGNNVFSNTVGEVVQAPGILVSNQSGGALAVGDVVRSNGTTGQVTNAQADTLANSAVLGVMITAAAAAANGYMAGPGNTPSVTCTAAPTAGAIVYLSVGTAARGTTTEPVLSGTQQKVKLGRVIAVSGSNARIFFEVDIKPENTIDTAPIALEVADAAGTFAATATWLIYTGAISANRAATLEALSTLSVGTRRMLSDLTTSGAFNITLTPNAADQIDSGGAGVGVVIAAGSKQTIVVRKTPTAGWKIE